MRLCILLFAFVIAEFPVFAQAPEYPNCTATFFKASKKVSTKVCLDKDSRFGKAYAYNRAGKLIYENGERRIAGHEGTHFSFYPDGAVRKAEFHSAPDAGIQWFRSTTDFAQDGSVTGFWKQSHDDRVTLQQPDLTEYKKQREPMPAVVPKPAPKQEAVPCASIYLSEAWFINTTPYSVRVTGRYTGSIADPKQVTIAPGDTVRGGGFVGAAMFLRPDRSQFKLQVARKPTRFQVGLSPLDSLTRDIGKEVRRYYFQIYRFK